MIKRKLEEVQEEFPKNLLMLFAAVENVLF
jgi:hypothetical protein